MAGRLVGLFGTGVFSVTTTVRTRPALTTWFSSPTPSGTIWVRAGEPLTSPTDRSNASGNREIDPFRLTTKASEPALPAFSAAIVMVQIPPAWIVVQLQAGLLLAATKLVPAGTAAVM